MPLAELRNELRTDETLDTTLKRLPRIFKVSKLVVLRRLLDANWLKHDAFDTAWDAELQHLRHLAQRPKSGGGDFHNATLSRVSHRFADALVTSTLEGQTLYRDAFRMLGIAKTKTFNDIRKKIGERQ